MAQGWFSRSVLSFQLSIQPPVIRSQPTALELAQERHSIESFKS
jgi:hypothetical protein